MPLDFIRGPNGVEWVWIAWVAWKSQLSRVIFYNHFPLYFLCKHLLVAFPSTCFTCDRLCGPQSRRGDDGADVIELFWCCGFFILFFVKYGESILKCKAGAHFPYNLQKHSIVDETINRRGKTRIIRVSAGAGGRKMENNCKLKIPDRYGIHMKHSLSLAVTHIWLHVFPK